MFVFFMLLIISPAYVFYKRIDIPLGITHPLNVYLGILISVTGTALYLWTIFLFARVDGTQLPIAPTQQLVTTGPYSITRNPMVTGAALIAVGLGIILNSLIFILISILVPVLYLIYIKLVEEKELEARFGEKYINYKKRTPFLIPKLWKNKNRK